MSSRLTRSGKKRKRRPAGTVCHGSPTCRRVVLRSYAGKNYCSVHLADRLVGERVKARDRVCVRCGSLGPLDWAHVVSRSYHAVRWSWGERLEDGRNNSVALCRPCHYWQGLHPLEGDEFFRSIGIDVEGLERLAISLPPEDPEDVVRALIGDAA